MRSRDPLMCISVKERGPHCENDDACVCERPTFHPQSFMSGFVVSLW
jgi:hypothetical protein